MPIIEYKVYFMLNRTFYIVMFSAFRCVCRNPGFLLKLLYPAFLSILIYTPGITHEKYTNKQKLFDTITATTNIDSFEKLRFDTA